MYNRTTNLERKGVFKINDAKKETVEAWYFRVCFSNPGDIVRNPPN